MTPSNKEVLKWSPDDKISIASVEDCKNKLNISELPEWELKEFFEEPIETTQSALQVLREKYLSEEPDLSTVKEFLTSAKNSVIKETQQWINEVKKIALNLNSSMKIEAAKINEGNKSAEKAEKTIDSLLESGEKIWGKAKEVTSQAKDIVKKWKSALAIAKILKLWAKWEKSDNIFFKFLWSIITIVWGLFGYEKVKDAWKKVKEKLNPEEIKKTKKVIGESVIKYIEKISWTNLDEKTKNKIKNKLSPKIEWSYISTEDFSKLIEKIKSWKWLSLEDIKETTILSKMLDDPDLVELKELLSENINKKLFWFFKTKFETSGVVFNSDSESKLKNIIKDEFNWTTIKKLINRAKESWWEIHFDWLEWIDAVFWLWFLVPNIIFKAFEEDILKVGNLAIWLVESGKDTLSIWLKALGWQNIIPDLVWRMNWDDFDKKISDLWPEKKLLLERAFYAELWIVSSVLGTIWFYWTSWIVSLIEWWSNVLNWKWVSTPPIARLEKTLNTIWNWKWTWLKWIEGALVDTKESYNLVQKLNNSNLDEITKQKYLKKLSDISWNFTDRKVGFLNPKNLAKITKNLNPLQTFHFTKSVEQLQKIAKTNEKLWIAITKWTFNKEILKAKQFIDTFKIRYINWRAVLNVADWLEGKQFAKAIWSLAPEIVRWLFKVAPILIVWGTIWDTIKEQKWEWYDSLLMLNGIAWWVQLFKNTEVSYTEEGLSIKNPESFAWWIALVWMEVVLIWKDIAKYGFIKGVPMAAFNSFVRLPLDAIKWVWWASVRWYEILKTARAFLWKAPKGWKIWLWVAILLWTVAAVEYSSTTEVDIEKLKEDWLINKDWEPNIEKLKDRWNNFEVENQEAFISAYAISLLAKPFEGEKDKFTFKLENWIFNIKIDKELKTQETTIKNSLEELARFLTEINSTTKLNITFN